MRRNAILVGIIALLLSITTFLWTTPSVANDVHPATTSVVSKPRVTVASASKKKRRTPVLVAAAVTPPSKPVPVYLAVVDQPGITERHKQLATTTLNALPPGCRDHLKTFVVQYSGAKRRGLGGKSTVILDGSVPDSEFVALLTHECGHVINGNLQGQATSGTTSFRDGADLFFGDSPAVAFWEISWANPTTKIAGTNNADFASGYAKSDAFEDFAETFAAYVLQHDMLRDRAKDNSAIAAKLSWMEKNLPLPEHALGKGTAVWDGTVPWDVTKLAFAL